MGGELGVLKLVAWCSGQVPGAMSNEEAWKAGRLLRIGESNFLVVMNPPCVDKVRIFFISKAHTDEDLQ